MPESMSLGAQRVRESFNPERQLLLLFRLHEWLMRCNGIEEED